MWLPPLQVDHFFRHRMNNSAVHSLNYFKQFPTPLVSIMAKFVSFVSGGLAGALIIIGFLGESILEGHVSLMFWIISRAKVQILQYKFKRKYFHASKITVFITCKYNPMGNFLLRIPLDKIPIFSMWTLMFHAGNKQGNLEVSNLIRRQVRIARGV